MDGYEQCWRGMLTSMPSHEPELPTTPSNLHNDLHREIPGMGLMVVGAWIRKLRYGGWDHFWVFCCFFSSLLWIWARYKWSRYGFLPPANGGGVSPCTASAKTPPCAVPIGSGTDEFVRVHTQQECIPLPSVSFLFSCMIHAAQQVCAWREGLCNGGTQLVIAPVPNPAFSSGSGLELNLNPRNEFYAIKSPNQSEPAVFWHVPRFWQLWTLAPIKYLSFDCITIWYIWKRCGFACSFTSNFPLCDPINVRWVAGKYRRKLCAFCSDPTNIDWISKWRIEVKRVWKTASFTYISYCDMITTRILNWRHNPEFTKMWL